MTGASLNDRVVEVIYEGHDKMGSFCGVGSGSFVSPRLVLTASHCIPGKGKLLVRLHRKEGSFEYPAKVLLQADENLVDLAVLEVSGVEVDVPRLRYGEVDQHLDGAVKECRAIGFPWFKKRDNTPCSPRSSTQVEGEIPTGDNLGEPFLLTLDIRNKDPRLRSLDESEWAGISGAVVFSNNDILVGVISEHSLHAGKSLTIVPITAIEALSEAKKWWELLGVDLQALVRLPHHEARITVPSTVETKRDIVFSWLLQKKYDRDYCDKLVYEHQVLGVAGLKTQVGQALDLEKVFVDPRFNINPLFRVSANMLHPPNGRTSIWDYLSNIQMAKDHLVILGTPGLGKTTVLKYLTLTLAQPKKYSRRRGVRHTFPILLFLREHADAIVLSSAHKDQPSFSLVEAIQAQLGEWKLALPTSWINRHLQKKRDCLVLLDGLDDIADGPTRKYIIEWIRHQIIIYQGNRFVLTSRPFGYDGNPLEGVSVTILEAQTFRWEQVEQFVQKWYLAKRTKEEGKADLQVRNRAREEADDLLHRLVQTPALRELAINPLLLTMSIMVHFVRGSLPEKRIELYKEMCVVLLEAWQKARGIQTLTIDQQQPVLCLLAYSLMKQERRNITGEEARQIIAPELEKMGMQPDEFLHRIENASGLLLGPTLESGSRRLFDSADDNYWFMHTTFQEYLAAVYIKEKGLKSELIAQVTNEWWHETIQFYCAQADATTLILACLKSNPLAVKTLILAFECNEEMQSSRPQVLEEFNAVWNVGVEDPEPERRRVIVEAVWTWRLRQMIHLQEETYIDRSLVTCAEYQLFLDEKRSQGHYYQPDHWTGYAFPKGSGNTPVLGVRRSDAQAFCEWLTARDREGWHYRLPHTGECPVKVQEEWKELGTEAGYWTVDKPHFEWLLGKQSMVFQQQLTLIRDNPLNRNCIDVTDIDLGLLFEGQFKRNLIKAFDEAFNSIKVLDIDDLLDLAHVNVKAKLHPFFDTFFSSITARDLAPLIAHAQAVIGDLDRNLASDPKSAIAHACDITIAFIHDLAHTYKWVLNEGIGYDAASGHYHPDLYENECYQHLVSVLNLYVRILLLHNRIEGNFPAYEGILLVKER